MGDHQQVPPVVQKVARIADNVAVRTVLAREQVTRPSVVTSIQKGVADRPAIFARDEDPHTEAPRVFNEITVSRPF